MKILKRCIIALAIALTMLATAQAETDLSKLSKLTPYDGKAAIEVIDSMGFEVIPRSELEEVRGEALPLAFVAFAASIGYDAIFNDGKNTIRTVALIYQKLGHPGFVKQLEKKGVL